MCERLHTIIVFSAVWSITFAQVPVGDKCIVKATGDDGMCKLLSDCPLVEEQVKRGIRPTVCGFYQHTPVVCCPTDNFNYPVPDGLLLPDEVPAPVIVSNNKLRISEQKCEEYSETLTEVVGASPLLIDSKPTYHNIEKCDYNSVPLIVGGEPALVGEFPFMVAIGFDSAELKWRCGGTLISDRYILTAAHCTSSRDAGRPKIIRLGDLDLSTSSEGSEEKDYGVAKVIVHPDYNSSLKYNDIALIETDRQIEFTNFIRPACLYTNSVISEKKATATGWGRTGSSAGISDRLMKVTLNIYKNSVCKRAFPKNKELPTGITSNMLCVGDLRGRKDTCQGDSGGPLLTTEKGNKCKFYVVGITSFGKSCGQVNTPAVYTKVSDFVDWIEQTIW